MAEQTAAEAFSLEEKLEELRKILEQMQKGMSDFDQQMELFTSGQALIQVCREYLQGAELKVDQLLDE